GRRATAAAGKDIRSQPVTHENRELKVGDRRSRYVRGVFRPDERELRSTGETPKRSDLAVQRDHVLGFGRITRGGAYCGIRFGVCVRRRKRVFAREQVPVP